MSGGHPCTRRRRRPDLVVVSLLFVAIALLSTGADAGSGSNAEVKRARKAALAHAKAGRFAEAVAGFDIAIEMRPGHGKTYYNKGVALWSLAEAKAGEERLDFLKQAAAAFEAVPEGTPAADNARERLAQVKEELASALDDINGGGDDDGDDGDDGDDRDRDNDDLAEAEVGAAGDAALATTGDDDGIALKPLPGKTLTQSGIHYGMQDDTPNAIKYFRAAAADPTETGTQAWNNLAVAYMRVGISQGGKTAAARRALRQSYQCLSVAAKGGEGSSVADNMSDLREVWNRFFPGQPLTVDNTRGGSQKGSSSKKKKNKKNKRGNKLEVCDRRGCRPRFELPALPPAQEDPRIAKVDEWCTEENMRFTAPGPDGAGGMASFDMLALQSIKAIFSVCGVVIIDGAFGSDLTDQLLAAHHGIFDEFTADHDDAVREHKKGRLALEGEMRDDDGNIVNPGGMAKYKTKIESRSKGRYEVKVPPELPWTDPRLIESPVVLPVVQTLLATSRLEIDTFSFVTSRPNTPHQHWHADTAPLFSKVEIGGTRNLPAHAVVMFMPLVNVTEELGPTKFLVGSHLKCDPSTYDKECIWYGEPQCITFNEHCPHANRVVEAPADRGSAVLFDLRILHAGGANKGSVNRPMMYLGWVWDWYVDPVNFQNKQTPKFDAYSNNTRKLLARVDSAWYAKLLEDDLSDRGGNLTAFQSQVTMNRVMLQLKNTVDARQVLRSIDSVR
eukprot:g2748.t1